MKARTKLTGSGDVDFDRASPSVCVEN